MSEIRCLDCDGTGRQWDSFTGGFMTPPVDWVYCSTCQGKKVVDASRLSRTNLKRWAERSHEANEEMARRLGAAPHGGGHPVADEAHPAGGGFPLVAGLLTAIILAALLALGMATGFFGG